MVELQLPKLTVRVRFPSSAPVIFAEACFIWKQAFLLFMKKKLLSRFQSEAEKGVFCVIRDGGSTLDQNIHQDIGGVVAFARGMIEMRVNLAVFQDHTDILLIK